MKETIVRFQAIPYTSTYIFFLQTSYRLVWICYATIACLVEGCFISTNTFLFPATHWRGHPESLITRVGQGRLYYPPNRQRSHGTAICVNTNQTQAGCCVTKFELGSYNIRYGLTGVIKYFDRCVQVPVEFYGHSRSVNYTVRYMCNSETWSRWGLTFRFIRCINQTYL